MCAERELWGVPSYVGMYAGKQRDGYVVSSAITSHNINTHNILTIII